MHGHTSKQDIFRSSNTSTFSAVRFDENPFTSDTCEYRGKKWRQGFKFHTFISFIGCFQVTSWQLPFYIRLDPLKLPRDPLKVVAGSCRAPFKYSLMRSLWVDSMFGNFMTDWSRGPPLNTC